jgi:hypothetical protein
VGLTSVTALDTVLRGPSPLGAYSSPGGEPNGVVSLVCWASRRNQLSAPITDDLGTTSSSCV